MKVQRRTLEPDLVAFATKSLPPSLVVKRNIDGTEYLIYARGHTPLIGRGDPIAEVEPGRIRLFETNYFSDMEDLIRRYENETGYEITLQYWQLPNEKPVA